MHFVCPMKIPMKCRCSQYIQWLAIIRVRTFFVCSARIWSVPFFFVLHQQKSQFNRIPATFKLKSDFDWIMGANENHWAQRVKKCSCMMRDEKHKILFCCYSSIVGDWNGIVVVDYTAWITTIRKSSLLTLVFFLPQPWIHIASLYDSPKSLKLHFKMRFETQFN